uniref:Leucine-rich repeat-containing N-terminal plant-type domain-containing protein n=1 Tax=Chenopodium quinoa TaxID=63459 RepID=A0A803L271_CHEQI
MTFKASVLYDEDNVLFSWKGDDCCSWHGVTCHNATRRVLRLDLRCDDESAYDTPEYLLYSYYVYRSSTCSLGFSELNPSLLELRQLRYLDLSGNDFDVSNIPQWIGSMKHLRYLNLSSGGFGGGGPPQLGNLTRLRALDLSDNFNSYSTNLHWLSSLVNLRCLGMCDTNITTKALNTIPQVLGHLPLLYLRLSLMGIDNQLLSSIFSNSTMASRIQHLDVSGNNLEGSIPHILSNMTSLKFLDLSYSQLNGSIPLWLGNMKDLEYLDLSGNRFSHVEGGTIMGILGNLCHLKTLNLRSSIVGGNFLGLNHDNFANCVEYDLEHLDLTFNNITNTLPKWLGELRNLKFIELSNGNTFYGLIPPAIGNMSSLIELNLNSCNLRGTIPTSLGGLSSLESLDLSNNFLEGSIPTSLGSLSSLQILDLSNNFLDGFIPTSLGSFSSLQNELRVLDLSNNRLFVEIIDWIPNVNLREINLSNNHIMGPIPHFFPSSQLRYIDLSYNFLSGPMFNDSSSKIGVVKAPLCHLENLQLLHLQRNQLSGTIPDCWGTSEGLSVIDLSSNKLSGSIPMTIGLLPEMAYLKLNNNSLEGTLPPTLNELLGLVILDIGENKLSGEVPHWDADSHPFLEIVIMRANQLEGVIPSQLCSLPRLQFLDLAMNNLTGSIPSCFGHFKSMKKSLQLKAPSTYEMALGPATTPAEPPESFKGENAMVVLKGEERQYTTTLKLVVNLDLSSNGLVGIIPLNIGEMGSLESLDLSKNNLSGTIPSSLSALNFLTSFNLSSNMLHGEIPTGNQLQTLNDPSIYGQNAGLCGDPLPKCGGKHVKQHPDEEEEEVESTLEKVMFYIVVMLGFAIGFWGVVGSLLYSRTWRHALFRRVEYVTDFLYGQVVVRIKRLMN